MEKLVQSFNVKFIQYVALFMSLCKTLITIE